MAPRASDGRYVLRFDFDAPLEFVYRWCTDYTPEDGKLDGDDYARRIVRRSSREVVYEDLADFDGGWFWSHHVVRLEPPSHWHSESVGSHRRYSLDYRLTKLPGNRTRLTMRAHRRPFGVGGKNPSQRSWQHDTTLSWKTYGRALERDYRKGRKGPGRKGRARRG
jgi:hypothetical protein